MKKILAAFLLSFILAACGGGGGGNSSSPAGNPGGDSQPPSVPSGLAATVISTEIDLAWNPSTDNVGVAGYKVYRGANFLKQTASTSASDTALNSGTQYCYSVSAFDAAGNESAQSSRVCATTLPPWEGPKEFGSSDNDYASRAKVDKSGNVFIAGYTQGKLGATFFGGFDAFLTKMDSSGNILWKLQWGTSADDLAYDVEVDSAGNAYVVGYTLGNLGGPNSGMEDAFLTVVDSSGQIKRTTQWGTSLNDRALGVALDTAGNIYISGYTGGNLGGPNSGGTDAFLTVVDPSGQIKRTTQWGTTFDDVATGVAVDSAGNAYIAAYTKEILLLGVGTPSLTVVDSSGTIKQTFQWGTGEDSTNRVAVAGNAAYVSGTTWGNLAGPGSLAGSTDAFVSKINVSSLSSLSLEWSYQLGTAGFDSGNDVALDGSGGIYLAGTAGYGALNGGPDIQEYDMFLVKLDSAKNQIWVQRVGPSGYDSYGTSVALDPQGNPFLAGYTLGNLQGQTNAGGYDVGIFKFDPNGNQQ